jgi:glucokinase
VDDAPVVLGLDFGGTKTALAVVDPDGTRLGSAVHDTRPDLGADASLGRAIAAGHELLNRVAPGRRLGAVGVATIGIPGEDGVALAPNIPGWDGLALGRELRGAFPGASIRLATDVKAAARVEAESGALVGCDPAIYLNLGTGLAVAIIANGAVVDGRNGASGEIGYNLRGLGDVGVAPDGRIPLEDVVSGKSLMAELAALSSSDGQGLDGEGLEGLDGSGGPTGDVFARVGDDPRLLRIFDRFVAELSFHLVNLAIAVDPARIAVGGGMVRSWDLLRGGLRQALDAAVPYPPELVRAAYPYDAPLMGALALGLAALREDDGAASSEAFKVSQRPDGPATENHGAADGAGADASTLTNLMKGLSG